MFSIKQVFTFLEDPWRILAASLEDPEGNPRQSMDGLWTVYGRSVEALWMIYGQSMDDLWTVYGESVDCLGTVFG